MWPTVSETTTNAGKGIEAVETDMPQKNNIPLGDCLKEGRCSSRARWQEAL